MNELAVFLIGPSLAANQLLNSAVLSNPCAEIIGTLRNGLIADGVAFLGKRG